MSFHVPEEKRILTGALRSSKEEGNNGAFMFYIGNLRFLVIASDGEGWEHVSVSTQLRIPTWTEMCTIKAMFWGPEDCVVQFHPPASQYVNNHPHCLHLWRRKGKEFELPPTNLVGIK